MNKDLLDRLQKSQEKDKELVLRMTQKCFHSLANDFSNTLTKELHIIKKDINSEGELLKKEIKKLRQATEPIVETSKALGKWSLKPALTIALSVTLALLTTCGCTWKVMQYLTTEITTKHHTLNTLKLKEQQLIALKGTKVVQSQIWLPKKPEIWQSQEGVWVVQTQK